MRLLLNQNCNMKIIRYLTILCLFFILSCSSTEFTISDIEAHYMIDESGALCLSVSFDTSLSESDTVYATLYSPDGKLTWETECYLAKTPSKTYRTLGDILVPYSVGGEWKLSVSRSDKTVNGSFILTPSTEEDAFEYPDFLKETRVLRVNGNVYSIASPSIGYNDNVEISAISRSNKRSEYVSYLNGERQKNVAISTDVVAVVFTYMNREGTVFRKTNVV